MRPALGAGAELVRWFVVGMRFGQFVEIAALGNHSAQSPATVWVTGPRHTIEHCKVKCMLCCVQQVWRACSGAAAGLGRWFVGVAVLLNAGLFQLLWGLHWGP